ncbi:hypothetical protein HOQ51_gp40 [uncultured phage_MedDCM-OCT-S35-C6]|nr:hypothetical protein HOQ51_gp40 [uncultured phage_MedDCM-OCT-S35-C6]
MAFIGVFSLFIIIFILGVDNPCLHGLTEDSYLFFNFFFIYIQKKMSHTW